MSEVGIRALKQNASAVVARAAKGENVTITDRGVRVARITALALSRLDELVASGEARPAKRSLDALPTPTAGQDLSSRLTELRNDERY